MMKTSAVNDPLEIGLDEDRLATLDAQVRRIFSENDFHAADMRTLARDAGMGFNTIYKYFGDKEGLLFFFVRRWQEDLHRQVLSGVAGTSLGKMRTIVDIFVSFYARNPDIAKIFFLTLPMTTWMSNETFSQKALTASVLDIIRQAQENHEIRRDIAAVAVLDGLMGALHRAFTMWVYRGADTDFTGQAEPLLTLFWNGVTDPDARPKQ